MRENRKERGRRGWISGRRRVKGDDREKRERKVRGG